MIQSGGDRLMAKRDAIFSGGQTAVLTEACAEGNSCLVYTDLCATD